MEADDLESSPKVGRFEKKSDTLFKEYHIEDAEDHFKISREQYVADRDANIHGTANPSLMDKPFWKFMIGPEGLRAWTARQTFGDPEELDADWLTPVWCFERFGSTRTEIPDGRIICIGGEHEDFYDPDFCIYNGVSPILTPDCIKIYGYPVDVFPPTDFHTSTYVKDLMTGKEYIYIVGGLGYIDAASRKRTEVYRLDLGAFCIQRLETSGRNPDGGISGHKAELVVREGQPFIVITTGEGNELLLRITDLTWI